MEEAGGPGRADEPADGPDAARPPRRRRRADARRAAILDAGLVLFSRKGLAGTSAEEIAAAADVSKTNLFYYFSSKEEIYLGVLGRLLDDWLAPLRDLRVEDDPAAALAAYVRRKLAFSRDNPEASRLFCLEIVQGAPLLGPALRGRLKPLVDEKAAVLRAWREAGLLAPLDPHHLLFMIWAATQHYADFAAQVSALTGRDLGETAFFEATVADVTALLLRGAAPGGVSGTAATCPTPGQPSR